MIFAQKLKTFSSSLKKLIKSKLIKLVFLDESYPNLKKYNIIPSETIQIPESQQTALATPLAYTTILEGAIYWSDYSIILTKDRKIISESYNTPRPLNSFSLKPLLNPKIEKISGVCMIYHQWTNNYYHTIIDNIPRFYLTCQQENLKNLDREIKLIHCRHISETEKFFLEPLIPNNVKIVQVKRNKLYYIENLIFSTFLSPKNCGFLTKSYRDEIFSRFLPQRPRRKQRRIFISRVKAYNGRHILNEKELVNVLKQFNFQTYILESMPLLEQIDLFYDAEIIIAAHGAGLTNIVFSEKAKVIELFPNKFFKIHYYSLARSMGHIYKHWHGNEQHHNSSFYVDVSQVKMLLEQLILN